MSDILELYLFSNDKLYATHHGNYPLGYHRDCLKDNLVKNFSFPTFLLMFSVF